MLPPTRRRWRDLESSRAHGARFVQRDPAGQGRRLGGRRRPGEPRDLCKLLSVRIQRLASRSSTADAAASNTGQCGRCPPRVRGRRPSSSVSIGAVAASDAFFPSRTGLQVPIDAGVKAANQPGGSGRGQGVTDAANAVASSRCLTGRATSRTDHSRSWCLPGASAGVCGARPCDARVCL